MQWKSESEVAQACLTLCNLWTIAYQALGIPLSMGFSKQEYWSRLLFPSPGIWCNTCNLLQQMRQLFKYWYGTICKILFTSKYKETEPLFIVIQETSYVFASNKETRWIRNQISKETLLIISFLIVWAIWIQINSIKWLRKINIKALFSSMNLFHVLWFTDSWNLKK